MAGWFFVPDFELWQLTTWMATGGWACKHKDSLPAVVKHHLICEVHSSFPGAFPCAIPEPFQTIHTQALPLIRRSYDQDDLEIFGQSVSLHIHEHCLDDNPPRPSVKWWLGHVRLKVPISVTSHVFFVVSAGVDACSACCALLKYRFALSLSLCLQCWLFRREAGKNEGSKFPGHALRAVLWRLYTLYVCIYIHTLAYSRSYSRVVICSWFRRHGTRNTGLHLGQSNTLAKGVHCSCACHLPASISLPFENGTPGENITNIIRPEYFP